MARKRFTNPRFLTPLVAHTLHPSIMAFIWDKVDKLPEERDYLQVFDLYEQEGRQWIRHRAEEPQHCTEYKFPCKLVSGIVVAKVYVIDDGERTTMLFSEQY